MAILLALANATFALLVLIVLAIQSLHLRQVVTVVATAPLA